MSRFTTVALARREVRQSLYFLLLRFLVVRLLLCCWSLLVWLFACCCLLLRLLAFLFLACFLARLCADTHVLFLGRPVTCALLDAAFPLYVFLPAAASRSFACIINWLTLLLAL